jgi:FkbM family methyltransferase
MICSMEDIKEYGITARGVIHVGAHEGQEYEEYLKAGIKNMMFFEPVESNFMNLVNRIPIGGNIHAYNFAIGSKSGIKEMYIESDNKGMSCSILEPCTHLIQYPWIKFDKKETVKMITLDSVKFKRSDYNILNVDVQGYELEVFKGAKKTLKTIDVIFTEVNKQELYKGCAKIDEIDQFLTFHKFVRIKDNCTDTWGDALYIKL